VTAVPRCDAVGAIAMGATATGAASMMERVPAESATSMNSGVSAARKAVLRRWERRAMMRALQIICQPLSLISMRS
jgi:hypothetical protein